MQLDVTELWTGNENEEGRQHDSSSSSDELSIIGEDGSRIESAEGPCGMLSL